MRALPALVNTAKVTSVASPVGGLNAYDNLAAMPSTDAIRMINFVPTTYGCVVRKGSQKYAAGMGNAISSLLYYAAIDGTSKFFAVAGSNLYDISNSGIVSTPLLTNLHTPSTWQSVNFANSAGAHLVACNGFDNPIWYTKANGLQRLSFGNGTDSGTWAGVDPAKLIQFTVHQRRLWGVQVDSTLGWFLPADSVYGTANLFDFGPFFKRGGYLAALGTWSADLGAGSDDQLVAISSEGEAAVFAGTNVADSTAWKLRGVYFIGRPPTGRRFFANVGGDLLILTEVGIVAMSTVLTSTTVNVSSNTAYSKKVQFLLNKLTQDFRTVPGWCITFFPSTNLLYVNIPSVYSNGYGQLVSNYVNTSWTTFSGLNATCWIETSFGQFFGTPDGTVYRAWIGKKDLVELDGSGGKPIVAACQQAYTSFQLPAIQKQVGMYRLVLLGNYKIAYSSKLSYDYTEPFFEYVDSNNRMDTAAYWDSALWDMSLWSGEASAQLDWRSALGLGVAVSLSFTINSTVDTTWVSTDFTYKAGGPL